MASVGNKTTSPFRFRLSSVLSFVVVVALVSGWLQDRTRLKRHSMAVESRCESRIDRLHLGLSVRQDALTFASIYRENQKMEHTEFSRYLQGALVATILQLFAVRDRVDEIELDDCDAKTLARNLVTLLGCESSSDFLEKANGLGFKESDFLLTYAPLPNELDELYSFIGLSNEGAGPIKGDGGNFESEGLE